MSCVLRVRGADFAVDEFLAGSVLKPIAIFRRGEPRLPGWQPGGPKLNASGFHVVASEAGFFNLQIQITDAVHFLELNQGELDRVVAFPGVEKVSLDFGIEERNVAVQSEHFPPNLLSILGSLGIWLEFTLYPCEEPDASAGRPPNESLR
jgi:hypothetical protein